MIAWILLAGLVGVIIGFVVGFHMCMQGTKKLIDDGSLIKANRRPK